MTETGRDDDWKAAWAPVIAQIGKETGEAPASGDADRVAEGAVRRYLEPLEFDCKLHYDAAVARAYGYPDIIAPYTAISSFAMPPIWTPGMLLFTTAERNAQPAKPVAKTLFPPATPPVTGYFATDYEVEYLRPVTLGERLTRTGYRLVACTPKETKIGRGAFVKFESLIQDEQGQPVARFFTGMFLYNPHPAEAT